MSKHDDRIRDASFGAAALVRRALPPRTLAPSTAISLVAKPSAIAAVAPAAYASITPVAKIPIGPITSSGKVTAPVTSTGRVNIPSIPSSSMKVPIAEAPAPIAIAAIEKGADTAVQQMVNTMRTSPDMNVKNGSGFVPPTGGGAEDPPPADMGPQAPLPSPSAQDESTDSSAWTPPDEPVRQPAASPPVPSTAMVKSTDSLAAVKSTDSAAPQSFWSKLLALFGFGKKAAPAATVHGEDNLQSMVESVVRRARNGDQNAMALIALVRDNAKKGHPKAQETFALLNEYVRCNPVGGSHMGYEPDYVALTQAAGGARWNGDPDYVALTQAVDARWGGEYADAVALSHGPLLTNPRIRALLARFNGAQQHAIVFGIEHPTSQHKGHAVRIGRILGHARRLQAVRHRMPLSHFDPMVGWELGE